MTTRETLRILVEEMDDDQVETLAELARECGLVADGPTEKETVRWIEGRDYPILAAIWDNDDDAIFDNM